MGIIVNFDGARVKVSPQAMRRGRYALANQAMADMNSFVPKKNNILHQNAYIKGDGSAILYETEYAGRQFYLNRKKYTIPETGPRWSLKAKSLYMPSWEKAYLKGADIQ